MKEKKKTRNTRALYWRLSQLPGYESTFSEIIKEGAINDLYIKLYGENHLLSLHLRDMSDKDYSLLLKDLDKQIKRNRTVDFYHQEAERKDKISLIFKQLGRLGVHTDNGYDHANYHIKRITKGKIIPQVPTGELDSLFKAVCSYCDFYCKKQKEERLMSLKN